MPFIATKMVIVEYQTRQTRVVVPQNQWSLSIVTTVLIIAVIVRFLLPGLEIEV